MQHRHPTQKSPFVEDAISNKSCFIIPLYNTNLYQSINYFFCHCVWDWRCHQWHSPQMYLQWHLIAAQQPGELHELLSVFERTTSNRPVDLQFENFKLKPALLKIVNIFVAYKTKYTANFVITALYQHTTSNQYSILSWQVFCNVLTSRPFGKFNIAC